jgi:hypothetical protein
MQNVSEIFSYRNYVYCFPTLDYITTNVSTRNASPDLRQTRTQDINKPISGNRYQIFEMFQLSEPRVLRVSSADV